MGEWIIEGHTTAVDRRGKGDSAPFDWPRIDRERREQTVKGTDSARTHAPEVDVVNHPSHYTWLSGLETIDVTEQFNFCLGNAIKYIMRAGKKGSYVQDLEKARWYINREIARVTRER